MSNGEERELVAVLEHHEVATLEHAIRVLLPRGTSSAQVVDVWRTYLQNCGRGWN